jgi:hypothetical protein
MSNASLLPDLWFRNASGRLVCVFGTDFTASPQDPASRTLGVRQEGGRTVLARQFSFHDRLPTSSIGAPQPKCAGLPAASSCAIWLCLEPPGKGRFQGP